VENWKLRNPNFGAMAPAVETQRGLVRAINFLLATGGEKGTDACAE
jgi:hypothetical protein